MLCITPSSTALNQNGRPCSHEATMETRVMKKRSMRRIEKSLPEVLIAWSWDVSAKTSLQPLSQSIIEETLTSLLLMLIRHCWSFGQSTRTMNSTLTSTYTAHSKMRLMAPTHGNGVTVTTTLPQSDSQEIVAQLVMLVPSGTLSSILTPDSTIDSKSTTQMHEYKSSLAWRG